MKMMCTSCNIEMEKDYEIKLHHVALLAYVSLKKGRDEKEVKACVCPRCGKVELYTPVQG